MKLARNALDKQKQLKEVITKINATKTGNDITNDILLRRRLADLKNQEIQ